MLIKNYKILKVIISVFIIVAFSAALLSAFSIKSEAVVPGGIISDGVYALKNKATGKYLDIQYDSYKENMLIQQYAYGSIPDTSQERSGLYKFTHRGDNGYLIRTMRNNLNTFKRQNDTKVITTHADPVDSNNNINLNWYLVDAGNGYYYLKAYGMEKYLCTPASGVNLNKYCTTEDKTIAAERAMWKLISYNGDLISGLKVNYLESQVMDMGTSRLISDNVFETVYFYSTDMNAHDRGLYTDFSLLTTTSNQSSIAAKVNNYLTGLPDKCGMVSVAAQFTNALSIPFNIYIKPTSGEYFFLQNVENYTGCVKSNGSYSQKTNFDYDDKQIWKRTIALSGTSLYYIQDINGNYLTAPNSQSSGLFVGFSQSLLSGSDYFRQLWRFDDGYSENAKIIKTLNMGNLCLNLNGLGILAQGSYSYDNTYNDEFNVVMLGTDVVYHRTFADFSDFDISEIVKNIYPHYNGFELIHLKNQLGENTDASDPNSCIRIAISMLENSKVMVFGGHANPMRITISDYNQHHWLTSGRITISNLNLSSVDIVIFDGCSSAGTPSSGYNLAQATANSGAKVVIGWTDTVYASGQIAWINKFFELMNSINDDTLQMYTAEDAVAAANDYVGGASGTAVIYGTNTSFSFN